MKIKAAGNNFKEAPAGIRKAAIHTACQTGPGRRFFAAHSLQKQTRSGEGENNMQAKEKTVFERNLEQAFAAVQAAL